MTLTYQALTKIKAYIFQINIEEKQILLNYNNKSYIPI